MLRSNPEEWHQSGPDSGVLYTSNTCPAKDASLPHNAHGTRPLTSSPCRMLRDPPSRLETSYDPKSRNLSLFSGYWITYSGTLACNNGRLGRDRKAGPHRAALTRAIWTVPERASRGVTVRIALPNSYKSGSRRHPPFPTRIRWIGQATTPRPEVSIAILTLTLALSTAQPETPVASKCLLVTEGPLISYWYLGFHRDPRQYMSMRRLRVEKKKPPCFGFSLD